MDGASSWSHFNRARVDAQALRFNTMFSAELSVICIVTATIAKSVLLCRSVSYLFRLRLSKHRKIGADNAFAVCRLQNLGHL